MGRVLVTTDGNGNATTSHYDADGNVDYAIDADGHRTDYTYNDADQETATTQADSSVTHTDYWPDGEVKDQIDAAGHDTAYTYDSLGHPATRTDPDSRTADYTYDADGNLRVASEPGETGCTTTSTASGCTVYSYDADNEIDAVAYHDSATPDVTNVSYDADGRETAMTDGTGTATWAYDSSANWPRPPPGPGRPPVTATTSGNVSFDRLSRHDRHGHRAFDARGG